MAVLLLNRYPDGTQAQGAKPQPNGRIEAKHELWKEGIVACGREGVFYPKCKMWNAF